MWRSTSSTPPSSAAIPTLWGQRYALISRPAGTAAEQLAELGRARDARELLYALFLARTLGRAATNAQLTRLTELAGEAYHAASLQPADDRGVRWQWSRSDLATIRHIAVTAATDLLRHSPSPRLKQCPGEHCGWFFLDTTKRGNRRWCSMSECGQEAKDERRRARRQAGSR
jgi:predicted RNA-binding Zn ribbon-like protein